MVCLENTHNKKGGKVLPQAYVDQVGALCAKHSIALHVDGARIWNAAAKLGVPPARCVAAADSVSVCLSKGLGAPVGSVIVGAEAFISKCRRLRKACGGGMRQAGTLAAAALAAYEEIGPNIARDRRDGGVSRRAIRQLEHYDVRIEPETNIFFVDLNVGKNTAEREGRRAGAASVQNRGHPVGGRLPTARRDAPRHPGGGDARLRRGTPRPVALSLTGR